MIKPEADEAPKVERVGNYFDTIRNDKMFSSGCAVLDCCLGGGYRQGRVYNIVGDASAGKSLCAIEATANFARSFPKGLIRYCEVEAAFDRPYAAQMGFPAKAELTSEEFEKGKTPRVNTVEAFDADIHAFLDRVDAKHGGLYVIDSLDALKTEAELSIAKENRARHLKGEESKGSFGVQKAKGLSEKAPEIIEKCERLGVTLIVVSQLRDKIGAMFGEKSTRAGGRWLNYYASVIFWVAQLSKIKKEVKGIKRTIGVQVAAQIKKSKIGLPYRTCEYPIWFGFGIQDLQASADWLKKEAKAIDLLGEGIKGVSQYLATTETMSDEEYAAERERVGKIVKERWQEIDRMFLPNRSKYV